MPFVCAPLSSDPQALSQMPFVSAPLSSDRQALIQMQWLSAEVAGNVPALKERCGWCVQCRSSSRKACLLVAAERVRAAAVAAGTSTWAPSWNPGSATKLRSASEHGRLGIVSLRLLQLEDQLQGLLDGPWEDFPWRKEWKRQVGKAHSISELRRPLREVRPSSDVHKAQVCRPPGHVRACPRFTTLEALVCGPDFVRGRGSSLLRTGLLVHLVGKP